LGRRIDSIFFGGGTPSLAPPSLIEAIIKKIAPHADTEITLEANPTSVEASKFRDYAAAGVNRVSIGVQSFTPEHLHFLGREHSADEAIKAIALAAKFFTRYSFDLIYMLPQQPLEKWQKELDYALTLANGHISLYQLTIEKGTKFFSLHRQKAFVLPNENEAADAYEMTNAIMESAGLPNYEVSNYAKLGQECKHNLTYWRYGDYIGIGPGAHGRYVDKQGRKVATVNRHSPEEWLSGVSAKGAALLSSAHLSEHEQYEEKVLMGLRLKEGMPLSVFKNKDKVEELLTQGFIHIKNNRVTASSKGLLVLNSLINAIL
jgi:oxygen-independent coproporphyrinogen-3 oxidase